MHHKGPLLFSCLAFYLASAGGYALAQATAPIREGSTRIRARSAEDMPIALTLTTARTRLDCPCCKDDKDTPISISHLTVRADSREILIPSSAIGDLWAPRQVSLERPKTGFVVKIEGGESPLVWRAYLEFRYVSGFGYVLLSRRKEAEAFEDVAWECTTYSANTGDLERLAEEKLHKGKQPPRAPSK